MAWPEPISLHGKLASVVPLDHAHSTDLMACAADGALHELWYTTVPAPDRVSEEISLRFERRDAGSWLPFAVIDAATEKPVGMTNYLNIDAVNRRVEIGGTWYRESAQRTGINTECKYLMLSHAFEELGCNAVEFRTHYINQRSRRAIERLGAKFDGILRAHMIMPNGTLRDTAVYSIIAPEWPTIKAHLVWHMEKPR
jgi:RimJ/RimL family protein N-acetyltransferase